MTTGKEHFKECERQKKKKNYRYLVTVVHQNEEEVKTTHDRSAQVHVLFQAFAPVIASTDWVGSSQDGRAGVQSGLRRTKAVFVLRYCIAVKRHQIPDYRY